MLVIGMVLRSGPCLAALVSVYTTQANPKAAFQVSQVPFNVLLMALQQVLSKHGFLKAILYSQKCNNQKTN